MKNLEEHLNIMKSQIIFISEKILNKLRLFNSSVNTIEI